MAGDPELAAMGSIVGALEELSPEGRTRVLRWAAERYEVAGLAPSQRREVAVRSPNGTHSASLAEFDEFADLLSTVAPGTDADRALLAAYWISQTKPDGFSAQEVNSLLKDVGYPVANITGVLGRLQKRRPAVVMQVKKAGTSRQARKTYRTSKAVSSAISAMLEGTAAEDE